MDTTTNKSETAAVTILCNAAMTAFAQLIGTRRVDVDSACAALLRETHARLGTIMDEWRAAETMGDAWLRRLVAAQGSEIARAALASI